MAPALVRDACGLPGVETRRRGVVYRGTRVFLRRLGYLLLLLLLLRGQLGIFSCETNLEVRETDVRGEYQTTRSAGSGKNKIKHMTTGPLLMCL